MSDLAARVARSELGAAEAALLASGDGVVRVGESGRLDVGRSARTGIPEVILARTKRAAEVAAMVEALLDSGRPACLSRMAGRHRHAVEGVAGSRGARVLMYGRRSCRVLPAETAHAGGGLVGLLAAGTSDAEALAEARMVCEASGCATRTAIDVGVAGLHRLFEPLQTMLDAGAQAIVVAAGMDGALPSVVAGLVPVPVVGLPTSTGYGAGGRGRGALLAMLQTCAPGLVVVNIDNGVGAGAAAARIARQAAAAGEPPAHSATLPSPRGR